MRGNDRIFPKIHANASFTESAIAHAHRQGLNAVELDGLAQAIGRLVRDHSTVISASMRPDMKTFEELGYLSLSLTSAGTWSVELLCAPALLSNYFWAVWIPRYLNTCSLKVAVMAHLTDEAEAQHCTVVFRIPGQREAVGDFLTDLGCKYPACHPEIIAIQVGHALSDQEEAR